MPTNPNTTIQYDEETHPLLADNYEDPMDGVDINEIDSSTLNKISENLLILKEQLNNGVFPFKFAAAVSLTNITTETLLDNETFESDLAAQTLGVLAGLPTFITADILTQLLSYLVTKHYREKYGIDNDRIREAGGKLDGFILTEPSAFIKNIAKFLIIGASTFEAYTIALTGLAYYTMPEQYAAVALLGPGGALALSSIVNQWNVPVDAISTIQLAAGFAGLGYGAISLASITPLLEDYMPITAISTLVPAATGMAGAFIPWAAQTFGQALNYRHNVTRDETKPRETITSNIYSFFSGCKETARDIGSTVANTNYNPFTRGA